MSHGHQSGSVHQECFRLSIAFANAVDRRDYERVLGVFTSDAVLERWDRSFVGLPEIAEMMNSRPEDIQTRHVCTNFELTRTSSKDAEGQTYFLFFRGEGDGSEVFPLSGPHIVGEYHDQFQLTDKGWRIAHRKIRIIFQQSS